MKLFTEESRVIYSDAFPHALAVRAIGNTNLAGLRVHTIARAPALATPALEARRAARLACWLARYGTIWPPSLGMMFSEFGPFPIPVATAGLMSIEEMARVAVEAAAAEDDEVGRVLERAFRGPFRRMHFEADEGVRRRDTELEAALRGVQVPVACSPLRDVTLGQVFDGIKSLHIVRRLVPGAVFTAAGVQTIRALLEGDLMMALGYAVAGTSATFVLHIAQPVETFADAYSREIAAASNAPALPVEAGAAPALPDHGSPPATDREPPSPPKGGRPRRRLGQ